MGKRGVRGFWVQPKCVHLHLSLPLDSEEELWCESTQAFPCLGCLMPLCRKHEHEACGEECLDLADMLGEDELSEWREILRERLVDLGAALEYSAKLVATEPSLTDVCLIWPVNADSEPLYRAALATLMPKEPSK